jgi:hypothetical protein
MGCPLLDVLACCYLNTPAPTYRIYMARELDQRQFQPGKSGNPSGRPKLGFALAEKVRQATRDGGSLIKLLTDVASGRIKEAKVSDRLAAADMLLSRGWGKAIQQVDIDVDINVTHRMDEFTTQELRDLLALQEEITTERPNIVEGDSFVVD